MSLIDASHVDVACVTETWIFDETHCTTNIDGCTFEMRDRVDKRWGGFLIYIWNIIPYHRIDNLECDEV